MQPASYRSIILGLSILITHGTHLWAADSPRPWNDYRTIMWVGDTVHKKPEMWPRFIARLREMGINGGMVYGSGSPQVWATNGFDYYVENIVNRGLCLKFNSSVTDWDAFVTGWARERAETGLKRDHGLLDPAWREWARKEMRSAALMNREHRPLAYDIRDELSVTISANPFDYDFAPLCLERFREWLKPQYPSLEALNRQWETDFATWAEVKPFTTDRIKHRLAGGQRMPQGKPDWQAVQQLKWDPQTARKNLTAWNFAPWADFRSFMDLTLAEALSDLRQAAHEADPATPVGIEGTQMPSAFGGYDLWRLSQALDWVEPYDIAEAREIWGSFMPGKPILSTVFETDTPHALRRLWHLLLMGDRGCLIWWSEDCFDWTTPNCDLKPKARALALVLKEMTGREARLFLRANREYDPIAIHYSQASIQADWLIESCVDGSTWLRRFSSFEADHNRMARVRENWVKVLQDLGYAPKFLSSEQIERGELERFQTLVMPQSLALSRREAESIKAFIKHRDGQQGRALLADGSPGMFDEHGSLLAEGPFDAVFPPALSERTVYARSNGDAAATESLKENIATYGKKRLGDGDTAVFLRWLEGKIPVSRAVVITAAGSPSVNPAARAHRYQLGRARLLALERNIQYQMSEDLKQMGGNQNLEKPVAIKVKLASPAHVYGLQPARYLGETDRFDLVLDPWRPALFALMSERIPEDRLMDTLDHEGR